MKIFRYIISFFLLFCVALTFLFGVDKIKEKRAFSENSGYKGILTLWHIDTFEGGSGSRKQFLLKIARGYEKNNQDVLVFVTSHTPSSVKDSFSKGVYPDMISYGLGVEVERVVSLSNVITTNGGKFGKEILAVPWCRGGYFLIENTSFRNKKGKKTTCLVSNSTYNLPLVNFIERNCNFIFKERSQLNAYSEFVNGGAKYLLGTQRDIVRLTNRGFSFSAEPLSAFNDLYQYVSVIGGERQKVIECIKFTEYLLSENSQKKLSEIDMFSCFYHVEFENEDMASMQRLNNFNTISAFTLPEKLLELKELSLSSSKGDVNSTNKLKKFIV